MASSSSSSPPSSISRTVTEYSDTIKDAYKQIIYGDDPGMHETFVYIARARPTSNQDILSERYDLGMTFIELNGRAFVNYVVPGSDADLAGIKSQYCLQLATSPSSELDELLDCDDQCIKYALDCERKGMRTSFNELRDMFESCSIHYSNEALFTSTSNETLDGQNVSLTKTLRHTTQEVVGRCTTLNLNNVCSNMFTSTQNPNSEYHPIFMVFRKTLGRQSILGNIHVGLPSFRLDDECIRAASIMKRFLPTPDTKREIDAWDELANGASTILLNKKIIRVQDNEESSNTKADNVEASAIRKLIKNAVGLAFVRASKVVLGVSVHFGSGIVISRLKDGSWSAPSAIGMYGAGLGFQFGLEVADFIFVIQTNEALENFRRGNNYTFGGSVGATVGGVGREAFGAASVSAKNTAKHEGEEGKAVSLAPIVAYAMSQGLYFGVSLEGSRIFVREDINRRTYQFSAGKVCTADEILSGFVNPPNEAEDLYTTLHNVEFVREISQLPTPPEVLRADLYNNWRYDEDNIFSRKVGDDFIPLYFLTELQDSEIQELKRFESRCKELLYEGVTVQRIASSEAGRENDTIERRTLFLMLPEVGSLRLGFLSKSSMSHLNSEIDSLPSKGQNDLVNGNMSQKLSINLSDVVSLTRISKTSSGSVETVEGLRIKIESCDGKILQFISNNTAESIVLFCALKLLIEKESARLGIRGGNSAVSSTMLPNSNDKISSEQKIQSIDINSTEMLRTFKTLTVESADTNLPHGSQNHVSVSSHDNSEENGIERKLASSNKYIQGSLLQNTITSNMSIPIPLQLCRALFLDSSSPLMKKWEKDRGDSNFQYDKWNLKKEDSPRSIFEQNIDTLMAGGVRNTRFDSFVKGELVQQSEIWFVDIDQTDHFVFTISEMMPRRGFSVKVRVVVRPSAISGCDVSMTGEYVPLGKNTSDQAKVHRAFMLLLKDVTAKYGVEGKGLLAGLLQINNSPKSPLSKCSITDKLTISDSSSWDNEWVNFESNGVKFSSTSPSKIHVTKRSEQLVSEKVIDETNFSLQRNDDYHQKNSRPETPPIEKQIQNGIQETFDSVHDGSFRENTKIKVDVKPLPKLRLDLMPSPREVDEYDEDESQY